MTPGYGFAYFRWRTMDYKTLRWDESPPPGWSKVFPTVCAAVRNWRSYDYRRFAGLQS